MATTRKGSLPASARLRACTPEEDHERASTTDLRLGRAVLLLAGDPVSHALAIDLSLLMPAIADKVLQSTIIRAHDADHVLAQATGSGKTATGFLMPLVMPDC